MNGVITQDLLEIINRAEVTQRFFDSKKSKDKLKNARGEAEKLDAIVKDEELLQFLFDELNKLDYVVTKDGLFSKKQSSKSLVLDVKSGLKDKSKSLSANLMKELTGLPLISMDVYQLVTKETYRVGDVLRDHYNGNISTSVKLEDYEKRERSFIQGTCNKILLGQNYSVFDGKYEEENGETKNRYRDTNIVDAGLEPIKQLGKKKSEGLLSELKIEEITEKYKSSLEYRLDKYNSDKVLQEQLRPILEKIYSLKKSSDIMRNMSDIVKNNLLNGQKFQISDKLLKEVNEMEKEIQKLEERTNKIEQKYKTKKEKEVSYQSKISASSIKGNTTIKPKETIKQDVSTQKKTNRTQEIEELKELKEKITYQSEEPKKNGELSVSDKQTYEKYKEIREILDLFYEKKNQYNSEEYFERDVVNALSIYKLGDSLEEITNNVTEIRNQLPVTNEIQRIIDSVKMEYDNVSDFCKVDENGLTNIENRIVGRLLVTQTSGNVSEELWSEINYYISRHNKLESELKWVLPNKNSYPEDVFEEMVTDNKKRLYANTNLINEIKTNNNYLKK